jgi:threonine aldolase
MAETPAATSLANTVAGLAGGAMAPQSSSAELAQGLAKLPAVVLDSASVETNIVMFELNGAMHATQAVAALRARGVRMLAMGPKTIRAVTHLDFTASQIERALDAAASALTEATP